MCYHVEVCKGLVAGSSGRGAGVPSRKAALHIFASGQVSILEQEQASAEQGNISLQYQAPTQPKSRSPLAMAAPREAPSNTPPRPSTDKPPAILFAGACHPFRLYKGGFLPVQVPEGALPPTYATRICFFGAG